MGCSGSKLEELEAVALCRGRADLIADAIRHRYALADAHAAYSLSLRSVGASLQSFLDSAGGQETLSSSSPVLSLPTHRKVDPLPPPSPSPPPAAHSRSHSGSGSHIQFQSSDDDDEDSEIYRFHSGNSSPSHLHRYHLDQQQRAETLGGGPTFNFHYARNQPQPPTVHFASVGGLGSGGGDPSSSSYSSTPPAYPNYGNYPYSYPSNNFYGFFGNSSSSPPPNLAPPPAFEGTAGESSAATPKPPLPPPSPPRVSTWDFLNPFEAQGYPSYTPSRSSREVRDEEGIPDLEDEGEDPEVVKEVYGDQKFVGSTSGEYKPNEEGIANIGDNSRSVEVENEEDVVEKKVVAGEMQRPPAGQRIVAASSKPRRYHNVSEIGSEIRVQFEKASEAVAELSKMLEVGKQPYYHRKSSVVEVSSVLTCVMPPSTSNEEDFLNFEEDIAASSKNLSLTLQKLYIWEKKLQDEVRAEEKMRLLHDRNCKRLRHLVERGAEGYKLEEVQKMINKLSTKIRIEIQVVDSISNKISKLRDEELWPLINGLIQGLVTMWKAMLECHRIQCQAISEAKGLDSIATGSKLDDTRLSAIVDLELELLRWTGDFTSWISAQKNYVKALNGWLVWCLHYEPEVTDDGVVPYSPGRIGAPPVFVICNYWSQAVDRISEMEVIHATQAFTNLRHLWEQHRVDPRHKMLPNGDMDSLVRAREREAHIIRKELDELKKKLVLVSGQNDLPGYSAEVSSLQLTLKQIFHAMENFTASSLNAYEELHMRSGEESGLEMPNWVARDHVRVL